jgi:hypothetical protein
MTSGPIDSPIGVDVPQASALWLKREREGERAVNVIAPFALPIASTVTPPFTDAMATAKSALPSILRAPVASPVIVRPELFLKKFVFMLSLAAPVRGSGGLSRGLCNRHAPQRPPEHSRAALLGY